jgi:hypothetical protein
MRLEPRKIPRPQRGQETIAIMWVLICHFGPTPPLCPTFPPDGSQPPINFGNRDCDGD